MARANPMMHFITVVRAVMLKGSGLLDVWRDLVFLAGAGALVLTVAVQQYHKRAA